MLRPHPAWPPAFCRCLTFALSRFKQVSCPITLAVFLLYPAFTALLLYFQFNIIICESFLFLRQFHAKFSTSSKIKCLIHKAIYRIYKQKRQKLLHCLGIPTQRHQGQKLNFTKFQYTILYHINGECKYVWGVWDTLSSHSQRSSRGAD